jgi:hypothetical protein
MLKWLLTIALCSSLLVACGASAPTTPATQRCSGAFEATVHQGPDAGLAVSGALQVQIDASGHLSGALVRSDGVQVIASGQTIGQAINMLFDLGNDQQLFGVGTLSTDLHMCQGVGGGPLTGPKPGDSGDWRWTLGR